MRKAEKMEDNNEKDIIVQRYEDEKAETIEAIRRIANDDEERNTDLSWKSILGGDILKSHMLVKQVVFVMFVAVLMLMYTGNRYASQQDAILIDSLQVRLQTEKYNVLTQSSELLYQSRQSSIEDQLAENGDTTLINQSTPPFLIEKEDNEDSEEEQ